MSGLYKLLLVAFILLSAGLLYIVVRQSRDRADLLPFEVSEDSVAAYARRADSLGRVAEILEADLDALGLLEQPRARLQLARLRAEIASLRTAVERWQVARTSHDKDLAYRECVLLYGRVSGMCEVLRTPDERGDED
ncbi:MAG: hypothetical protein R6X12_05370 [bacterium]